MQRQLDALGLDYEFIEAVDKYDVASSERRTEIARSLGMSESTIDRYKHIPYFYDHLSCTLSHIKAYNLMLTNNVATACILEDDSVLPPDFPEILCASLKKSWDILMLSSHSRSTDILLGTNPDIQKSIERLPEVDCSLFPILRAKKSIRPPVATRQSQLDVTLISQLHWYLLMLLSYSKNCNKLFKYIPAICNVNNYRVLYKSKKKNQEKRHIYIGCKSGGLPIRNSQKRLYGNYDIAIPAEIPLSAMAYLLTLEMAKEWKEFANSHPRILVDIMPWYLHLRKGIRLRITTPACVTPSLYYLVNSSRDL